MRRVTLLLLAALPAAAACGSSSSSDESGGGGGSKAPVTAPAGGIAVSQVDVYQGVQSKIMQDGAETAHTAPIVQGRDATVRVHVATLDGFEARDVVVNVEVESDGVAAQTFSTTINVQGASNEADLDTTAQVAVPGAAIGANARLAVSVVETAPGVTHPGDAGGSRWPAADKQALAPEVTNQKLRVVLVPVAYLGDGSGRVPNTDETYVETLRKRMYWTYPTPEVEVTVGEAMNFSTKISGTSSNAWASLVMALINRRAKDKPEKDVYYYGVVNPANSLGQFCGGGCIAGLTITQNGPQPAELRVSAGLGFGGEITAGTFIHETGHAHGLNHAPCVPPGGQLQGVDSKFPYKGARLGSFGLDDKGLRDPNKYVDMMSYCEPTFISDYNYKKLAVEIQRVNGARVVGTLPSHWRVVLDDGHGGLETGERIPATDLPTGEPVTLIARGRDGVERAITAYAHGFDHADGRLLMVPDDGSWTHVRVGLSAK